LPVFFFLPPSLELSGGVLPLLNRLEVARCRFGEVVINHPTLAYFDFAGSEVSLRIHCPQVETLYLSAELHMDSFSISTPRLRLVIVDVLIPPDLAFDSLRNASGVWEIIKTQINPLIIEELTFMDYLSTKFELVAPVRSL